MPKRTNEFQKLIYLIQSQLAGEANVTESDLLEDKQTEELVEVDIVIRSKISNIQLVIGIECTAKSRPATVEWVREMVAKHEHLPVDKTVLVSKSGFTLQAVKKAQANNAEVFSLKKAGDTNWLQYLAQHRNLKLASFTFRPLTWLIQHEAPDLGEPVPFVDSESLISEGKDNQQAKFRAYIDGILRHSSVGQAVIDKWLKTERSKRESTFEFTVTWQPSQDTTITDNNGRSYLLYALKIHAVANVGESPLTLHPVEYGGKSFAVGSTRNIFSVSPMDEEKVYITILENNGRFGQAAIMLPNINESGQRVFTSQINRTENG